MPLHNHRIRKTKNQKKNKNCKNTKCFSIIVIVDGCFASIYTLRPSSIHLYTKSTLQKQFGKFIAILVHKCSLCKSISKQTEWLFDIYIYTHIICIFSLHFSRSLTFLCFVHGVFHLPFHLAEEKKKI